MPELPDGRVVSVVHSNPVTQQGFTQIPNAVLLRPDLGPLAKLAYGYLCHLAWKNGDREIHPPRDLLAADLNASVKQVTTALRELSRAPSRSGDPESPPLVESRRRGQGLPNLYIVNDPLPARKDDIAFQERQYEAPLERPDRPRPARARPTGSSSTSNGNDETDVSSADEAPKVALIDGRNLPLDALAEECGIDPDSPRLAEAAKALNGDRGKANGIRHLFWREAVRWAEQHPDAAARLEEARDPEAFAGVLEAGIRRKAALYRDRMNGALLTPGALRKWWLDLERGPNVRGGRLSADEIARMSA